MVKGKKWNRYDLKNINYNKMNNLFFLSVSKVYASLTYSGISPVGYMSRGIYVLGGIIMSRG